MTYAICHVSYQICIYIYQAGFIKNLVRMGGWAGRISTRSAQGLAHKVLRTRFAHKVPQGFAHKVFKGLKTLIFLKVL